MIADCKKWHYFAVKNFSALFREIYRDFICLNFINIEQKINLKDMKMYAKIITTAILKCQKKKAY